MRDDLFLAKAQRTQRSPGNDCIFRRDERDFQVNADRLLGRGGGSLTDYLLNAVDWRCGADGELFGLHGGVFEQDGVFIARSKIKIGAENAVGGDCFSHLNRVRSGYGQIV